MKYNNNMSYSQRIDKHFARGIEDAKRNKWSPGLIAGDFMKAYRLGQLAGKVTTERLNATRPMQ